MRLSISNSCYRVMVQKRPCMQARPQHCCCVTGGQGMAADRLLSQPAGASMSTTLVCMPGLGAIRVVRWAAHVAAVRYVAAKRAHRGMRGEVQEPACQAERRASGLLVSAAGGCKALPGKTCRWARPTQPCASHYMAARHGGRLRKSLGAYANLERVVRGQTRPAWRVRCGACLSGPVRARPCRLGHWEYAYATPSRSRPRLDVGCEPAV